MSEERPPLRRVVVMIHDWKGHRYNTEAICSGTTVLVYWGLAAYPLSLRTGRLKGTWQTRMWRMRRNDLAAFRKHAGWRRPDRDKVTTHTPGEKEIESP